MGLLGEKFKKNAFQRELSIKIIFFEMNFRRIFFNENESYFSEMKKKRKKIVFVLFFISLYTILSIQSIPDSLF